MSTESPVRIRTLVAAAMATVLVACAPEEGDPGGAAETELGAGEPARPEASRARLVSERSEHDFGTVYIQADHRTVFAMEAVGEEDLVIHDLKHSCGCTEGSLFVLAAEGTREPVTFGTPYPPGTRFELDANLNTRGRSGSQEQKLIVMLDDGIETFVLRAVIESYLVAEPPMLFFEGVVPTEGASGTVTLTSRAGGAFVPSCWRKIGADTMSVEFTPSQPDEEGRAERWTMDVRIPPGSAGEFVRGKLILSADMEGSTQAAEGEPPAHRQEFHVRAQVDAILQPWPQQLDMGRVTAGQSAVKSLVIRNMDPEFVISDLDYSLQDAVQKREFEHAPLCNLSSRPREGGKIWEITLEVPSLPRPGPFAGTIVVETGHPLQERIVVPFRGVSFGS